MRSDDRYVPALNVAQQMEDFEPISFSFQLSTDAGVESLRCNDEIV